MSIIKKPYELSIWIEKLNENGTKDEIKGAIIGAHDMEYPGRATNIVLKRELKGTNTLTFQMPDCYFDSLIGDYIRNDFIDSLIPERKIKLFYDNQWFEFFIKKISEKKVFKSYMKSYTCEDAFIDELSRNGYGLTFDEDLYNNVEEKCIFTEETLDGSLWHYAPEYNWGDFTEFTEEKLYRIPLSQFGGRISGYKLSFDLSERQREKINKKEIENIYTGDRRLSNLSDDVCYKMFWDQQNFDDINGEKENPLFLNYVEDIPNDGYIYVPYSCLNFCYGSEYSPDEKIKYDRAATETALEWNNKIVIAPQSVDPRTIIQFYVFPKNLKIEVDDAGVILTNGYNYILPLREWNAAIQNNIWYFFEDTRLVDAETLGAKDLADATISHTFRYLFDAQNQRVFNTYRESYGNKVLYYDGYLNDSNGDIISGKKYSITDRTEINISDEIDQYVTVYNNSPDEYKGDTEDLYSNSNWEYIQGDNKYKVCSKIETRQVIPQLARNLIQNGINIQSTDGWQTMKYTEKTDELKSDISSGSVQIRMINSGEQNSSIKGTVLYYCPPYKEIAYIWVNNEDNNDLLYQINGSFYKRKNNNVFYKDESWKDMDIITLNRKIRSDYSQKKNSISNKNEILYLYANDNDRIEWEVDGNKYSKDLTSENYSVLNFGIIGQNKKIEKDKIYCLGIELFLSANSSNEDNFEIQIGQGSLISSGDYSFSDKIIKITKEQIFKDIYIGNQNINWEELNSVEEVILSDNFNQGYILFRSPYTIENPYFAFCCKRRALIKSVDFFEAYTKGQDSFIKEEAPFYRYSGRDLFGIEQPNEYSGKLWEKTFLDEQEYFNYYYSEPFITIYNNGIGYNEIKNRILFEDMIMLGSTYEYQHYFIQRLKAIPPNGKIKYYDTCGAKEFISSENLKSNELPLDAALYTEDNYLIETNYINLNKCKYYNNQNVAEKCDCSFGSDGVATKVCYYQKFGYCPYRFQTEKHCRKIRTLKISKSNRFNIIQEISKVFEVYPQFYIKHTNNGRIIKDENSLYEKIIFYITEKGSENQVGFKYGKNLKDISRELASDKIVSKLYVQDVDSELSRTGLCSIKTAADNISKDSFIIDLSYYIKKGLLDKDEVERDLYGNYFNSNNFSFSGGGFLRQLGYYNEQYDKISNKIINLQDSSFTELEANLNVNLQGIITAQEQLNKIKKQMEHFSNVNSDKQSQSYLNYKTKKEEQEAILMQLISGTFYTDGLPEMNHDYYKEDYGIKIDTSIDWMNPIEWFTQIVSYDKMRENWVEYHLYTKGILGQYNKEYNQIQAWKKERASYLKMINKISEEFYKKYEPYLKEGTWSDSNYLDDNAYYFGALQVAAQGAIPKVSYNISVIGIDVFEEYKDFYSFYLGDVTWVEDEGLFGINQKTGFPNKLRVMISEITYNLDEPAKDSIKVQNYTTKFEDLFQQVTASVQSLQYNENIYKRSSNFTSLQNIETSSLQGTLDKNNLTLLNTSEDNIKINNEGTRGSDINNHANQYKQNGQGIFFSNDGGQHWNVGIGPSGINADYIKVGTLDASKIRIVDGNYLYFSWDKDGIVSYRDPTSVNTTDLNRFDFVSFNKYGLSLVENDKIRLRAGYNFNGNNGEVATETEPGQSVGFYLYNSNGQEIFSTDTPKSSETQNIDTARIKLIGEMFISDLSDFEKNIDCYVYQNKYDKVVNNFAYLTTFGETVMYHGEDQTQESYWEKLYTGVLIYNLNEEAYEDGTYNLYRVVNGEQEFYWATSATEFIVGSWYYGYRTDNQSVNIIKLKKSEKDIEYYSQSQLPSITAEDNKVYIYIDDELQENIIVYRNTSSEFFLSENKTQQKLSGGSAAIILNNKQNFKNEDTTSPDKQRLICIANKITDQQKNEETIRNIITVLKDGSLYIGGEIKDADNKKIEEENLENLPDLITVHDAYISMIPGVNNNNLNMDISNIQFYKNGRKISGWDLLL